MSEFPMWPPYLQHYSPAHSNDVFYLAAFMADISLTHTHTSSDQQ